VETTISAVNESGMLATSHAQYLQYVGVGVLKNTSRRFIQIIDAGL